MAYSGFDVDQVAAYEEQDRARLLADAGIIRNRLKVNALIENARIIQGLRDSHNGFANWIKANHPLKKDDWVKLFKKTFRFTGGEITNEFLISIGYLPFAHREDCPTYREIVQLKPPWMDVNQSFWR
jgi:DNA-3-methyladenine glycosylase I